MECAGSTFIAERIVCSKSYESDSHNNVACVIKLLEGRPVMTTVGGFLLLGAFGFLVLLLLSGVRYVSNDRIGVVEKRWSLKGSLQRGFIALNGEAGFQPEVLRGGVHYLTPFQYKVHTMPLVTIPQGKIGYVFARDGLPLAASQTLASNVNIVDFQDVRAFLADGGQRGPQRQILREGTFAINLAEFVVLTQERVFCLVLSKEDDAVLRQMSEVLQVRHGFSPIVIQGTDDAVGVVTVHDGPALPSGEIIAPTVGENPDDEKSFHNNFQNPEAFLRAGGFRGRQLQVLVDGTFYVNRLFATVEPIKKTVIEVGTVGVVVSYTGDLGSDVSGVDYKHGELVARGQRGVWREPLMPGKYAFNTYAGKVVIVPTTNFILKWNRQEVGAHRFDENLAEVSLITKDAFEPSLPLSVVVHIDYRKAPLVIQRFGDIKRLVEQTLDPMVAAHFKNVGQVRTLIELLQDRSEIQLTAAGEMKKKFDHYNLELEEVLIGTPTSAKGDNHIEQILAQLRQRQIASEQVETYVRQQTAAVQERELREAEARAQKQTAITESELSVQIQENMGRAEYQRSVQQAAQIRALAEAEAEKVARIGLAEAIAIEEQVRAYGGPKYQVTQQVMQRFADAIAQAKVDVVPRVVVQSGGQGGSTNLVETLLSLLMTTKIEESVSEPTEARPELVAMRDRLKRELLDSTKA